MQENYKGVAGLPTGVDSAIRYYFDNNEGLSRFGKIAGVNASSAVSRTTSAAIGGGAAVNFDTGATTPAADDSVTGAWYLPNQKVKKLRWIQPFQSRSTMTDAEMDFSFQILNAQGTLTFALTYKWNQMALYYLDSANTQQQAVACELSSSSGVNHLFEMEIDVENGKYISAKIGQQEVSLAGISAYLVATPIAEYIRLRGILYTRSANQKQLLFDNSLIIIE